MKFPVTQKSIKLGFFKGSLGAQIPQRTEISAFYIRITSDPFSIPCVNRMSVIDPNRNTSVVVYMLLNQPVRLM